jgi:hypothetical protein
MSESEKVHLFAPDTSENDLANVYCPFEKEFTTIILGRSADGMETYACGACYEPEPVLRRVTNAEFDALAEQHRNTK